MQATEVLLAPIKRSAMVVHGVGQTALELFDSERLVRRLTREHYQSDLHIAQESLDTALQSENPELVQAQAVYMGRVIARSLLEAAVREETAYGEQIELLRTMLREHLPDRDVATLGMDEREAAVFRGLIEQ